MAEVIVQEESLVTVADAIREKTGGTEGLVFPTGFAEAISGIESGGNTDAEDGIVTRTITEYKNDRLTTIGRYAFYYCTTLTNVDFPNVTYVGTAAFCQCNKLKTINIPSITKIGAQAFYMCNELTTIDFPNASTNEGKEAFYNCNNLSSINLPILTSIGESMFYMCQALTSADFPMAKTIGKKAFYKCSTLATTNFPVATSVGMYAFQNCTALITIDFPMVSTISTYAFSGCSQLTTLIIRNETMATLNGTNAFTSTPIASGTGYIYVPSALLATYQEDSVWSTYSAQFRALEDYTVDGTTTGALDETKI